MKRSEVTIVLYGVVFHCIIVDYAFAVGIQYSACMFNRVTQGVEFFVVDIPKVAGEDDVIPALFHASLRNIEKAELVSLAQFFVSLSDIGFDGCGGATELRGRSELFLFREVSCDAVHQQDKLMAFLPCKNSLKAKPCIHLLILLFLYYVYCPMKHLSFHSISLLFTPLHSLHISPFSLLVTPISPFQTAAVPSPRRWRI